MNDYLNLPKRSHFDIEPIIHDNHKTHKIVAKTDSIDRFKDVQPYHLEKKTLVYSPYELPTRFTKFKIADVTKTDRDYILGFKDDLGYKLKDKVIDNVYQYGKPSKEEMMISKWQTEEGVSNPIDQRLKSIETGVSINDIKELEKTIDNDVDTKQILINANIDFDYEQEIDKISKNKMWHKDTKTILKDIARDEYIDKTNKSNTIIREERKQKKLIIKPIVPPPPPPPSPTPPPRRTKSSSKLPATPTTNLKLDKIYEEKPFEDGTNPNWDLKSENKIYKTSLEIYNDSHGAKLLNKLQKETLDELKVRNSEEFKKLHMNKDKTVSRNNKYAEDNIIFFKLLNSKIEKEMNKDYEHGNRNNKGKKHNFYKG